MIPDVLQGLLEDARRAGATALHLIPDSPAYIRLGREMRPLDPEDHPSRPPRTLSAEDLETLVEALVPAPKRETILRQGEGEFSIETTPGHTVPFSVFRAQRAWRVVILLVPSSSGPVSLEASP